MQSKVKISLNISTYNWPAALHLCLLSVKAQRVLPDEVVITDDGSKEETRLLIESFQQDFAVPIKHVWQPDEGFQLARIRNKGIAASSGDYIIQIDGDLILHPMFVADHIAFSEAGTFTGGSRVLLDKAYSAVLLKSNRIKINFYNNGVKNKLNGIRSRTLTKFLSNSYKVNDIYYLRGCNMAFWRTDLIKVNGYNEALVNWGREDNEIAIRLVNSGVTKRSLKFGGIVYHLYHQENNKTGFDTNNDLLKQTIEAKSTFCIKGLDQY
ncbi:glycosyltransferase involved in cell wall biosynthesis [Mucilaginibacter sp. UYP25]|uniref:glycosyltransferase family 2 protein n=1 Tax=unclassified Mucilaginibacter TaxID=2617802 RepID=UPI0033941649